MRKIRFGVVGTNFVTDWVIAGARQDPRFELAAVCSRTRERAAEFAARHGIARTFVSLEEMAASDAIDAVYIATPNCMHAAQAVCCMERGKHVLCEKPMASNAREVRAMIEASRRNGVALMEAVKTTLTPNFMALREALPKAGTLRRYFSAFCQYSSRYDKFKEGVVLNAFRPELSNGAMMDIGIYTIYPMVVLFGRRSGISASGILLKRRCRCAGYGRFRLRGDERHGALLQDRQLLAADRDSGRGGQSDAGPHQPHRPCRVAAAAGCGLRTGASCGTAGPVPSDGAGRVLLRSGRVPGHSSNRAAGESSVNSHENSLATIGIIDEYAAAGVVYPADLI